MTGGRWVVENGVLVGRQDPPNHGGLLLTDAEYGDVEVSVEMNNDFGPDSGLFLRCTEPVAQHPPRGHIGLQVHGGASNGGFVRYRNLRVRAL